MIRDIRTDGWLDMAVSGIRFKLDRQKVRRELLQHIEDKTADLQRIFPDIPEAEAQERALAGMGDPEELKISLAKVHRPWWGWLWYASHCLLCVVLILSALYNMTAFSDYRTSLWGRSGETICHRIQDGEKTQFGGYTFQITAAACLDRPEAEGAEDSLQVVLRASSPRFWERIDLEAIYNGLSAVGPGGERYPMDRATAVRYTVADELGNTETRQRTWIGVELCEWGPWWREFAVYIPAEGWQSGDRVTLEFQNELGGFALSAPVTERVRVS